MLAKMIDKIVGLKETKIFEIDGQTYADASLTRIPPPRRPPRLHQRQRPR